MTTKNEAASISASTDEASAKASHEPNVLRTRVPPAAQWLGALGAVPFVSLAIASPLMEGTLQAQASFALAAYGAVILSFLGGISWGLAIAGFGSAPYDEASYSRLILSVIPSLIGWGALFLPVSAGLLVLAAAFAAMLWVDVQASRKREAPAWYPRLRRPLTTVVVASLILGALA